MTKEDIKRVLSENLEILRRYKAQSISLFGSYVRNEQKEDSDIDLLVEFKGGITLFDIIELENSLSEIFKKKVTIVSKRGLSKYIGPYILREAESIGEGL
ncbi:MAG: nucleotidyltransferase family protein [Deltaproteobacteria bacterium]|nr:nucleotidyltransferase family protein [Deltaproteobacteria bacterium]